MKKLKIYVINKEIANKMIKTDLPSGIISPGGGIIRAKLPSSDA
ncbi:hypothetical protein ACFL9T_13065 [Thermodesulfobacteriota bacterium]